MQYAYGQNAVHQWTLWQNYCILIRAHLRELGHGNFPSKTGSLESVNNNVQISSPQLLLSKRYSRLKSVFPYL